MNKHETILKDVRLWLLVISTIIFFTMVFKSYPMG